LEAAFTKQCTKERITKDGDSFFVHKFSYYLPQKYIFINKTAYEA
jgi:hypothetical protein